MSYRRPFLGNGLTDVNLFPENDFNITSAYGCYLKPDADNEGYDPKALYDTDSGVGCDGQWQSVVGIIAFSTYTPGTPPALGTITSSIA